MAYLRSGVAQVIPAATVAQPVFVGRFSPAAHVTAGNGSENIDLSQHTNMHGSYTDYVTESGYTVTIVKSGLYHFDCKVMAQADAGAHLNLYVYVTGYDQHNFAHRDTTGSDMWNALVVGITAQLVTGNTIYQTLNNDNVGQYHHHDGPSWTQMSITYLG